jgi:hypothetical protein
MRIRNTGCVCGIGQPPIKASTVDTRCWRLQHHAVRMYCQRGDCDGCMIGVVGGWVMVGFASTWTACTDLSVLYCTVQCTVQ